VLDITLQATWKLAQSVTDVHVTGVVGFVWNVDHGFNRRWIGGGTHCMNTLTENPPPTVSEIVVMEYDKGSDVNEVTVFVGNETELFAIAPAIRLEKESM